MHDTPLSDVQHAIARAILGDDDAAPFMRGRIALRPHQRAAAARLVEIVQQAGGALLAEPVGVGKTYTALAAAGGLGNEITIVAPASLRAMWQEALEACAMTATLVTHEALSRGAGLSHRSAVVVIDEAHRFRVPTTRRYGLVAELCRQAKVLLVSATPVQNQRDDLAAVLALFLGRQAFRLTDEQLATYVVRGLSDADHDLPRLIGPIGATIAPVDDCLDELLRLPSPVPAKDESLPAALLTIGLLHQWSSSRAALVAALKRRRARALAMLSAIEAGSRPTRAELSAWTYASDALQLAFPALVVADTDATPPHLDELRHSLDAHQRATGDLLRSIERSPNPDDGRAAYLNEVCARHPAERIIAFCHYEETVNSLWSRLARRPAVAALTAKGARVAGGPVSRESVLRQFIPGASRSASPATERIQLLLTTDLLSEGLNLQEASVVVHLDYPWNPARLDQRVGRIRRIGSRHESVTVYALAPPAPVERLLQLETRLSAKLRVASRTIGVAGHILPAWSTSGLAERSLADSDGELRRQLIAWRCAVERVLPMGKPIISATQSVEEGFLALLGDEPTPRLVTNIGGEISTSPARLLDAVRLASGPEAKPDPDLAEAARHSLDGWLANRCGSASIDFSAAAASRTRRLALNRVAHALSSAPRHRRMMLAPLAAAARAAATAPLPEGAERVLDTLVSAELSDEAWLRSVAAFGELNARRATAEISGSVEAIILFQRAP
ncbi:MAG TPA: DEAD/DEAH box helicase [Gemmatimonadaceae bacterium]|nr:DEAD/DEAH box helicase [Gemmatimonadaceae bacterium]